MADQEPEPFKFNDLAGPNESVPDLSPAAKANLQCNILTSTGRVRSKHVFRRFDQPQELWRWLVERQTPTASTNNNGPEKVVTILFSAEALAWLKAEELGGMDPAFLFGSRDPGALRKLGAKEGTENWGVHAEPWHVVEIHAHNVAQPCAPSGEGHRVIEHGTGIDQDGSPTNDGDNHSFGHFRIADGVSKFVYRQHDYEKLEKPPGEEWRFDPRQKLSTLLVKDPLTAEPDCYGSYFVFAKYHQDYAEFNAAVTRIIETLIEREAQHDDEEGKLNPIALGLFERLGPKLAAARANDTEAAIKALRDEVIFQIFGRDPAGKTLHDNGSNDFTYAGDQLGRQCPFHAHIRKMNPRGDTGAPAFERTRAFARRGTSYDATTVAPPGEEGTVTPDTGLLFWSAQASIRDQFEYIMEYWANLQAVNPDHNPIPDIDAVIGSVDAGPRNAETWRAWKDTTHLDFSIWDSVQLVGAEYLYAPSRPGFESLQNRAARLLEG
jgi:hypothetical protein